MNTDEICCSDAVEFLESAGWTFELDWDDELIVSVPAGQAVADLVAAVKRLPDAVVDRLRRQRRRNLQTYVDGPLQGRSYQTQWGVGVDVDYVRLEEEGPAVRVMRPILVHVSRGRWACYRVAEDGRAYFIDWASSRKKARALVWETQKAIAREIITRAAGTKHE